MSLSDESVQKRISQLEKSRSFWKRLALGQMLLLALVLLTGVATSGLMAVRARQAERMALEESRRAREAADQARHQADEAARAKKAENKAREKDRK